jgi:hypothetical protein
VQPEFPALQEGLVPGCNLGRPRRDGSPRLAERRPKFDSQISIPDLKARRRRPGSRQRPLIDGQLMGSRVQPATLV